MDFYLILIVILMTLAVVDLIVGVSNDAVNFLNSAIGSRVASFQVILGVASVGILCGALFSSGMMEIARNGIFNPGYFSFDKIMIVFMAVMLTDIILLDFLTHSDFQLPLPFRLCLSYWACPGYRITYFFR
jgi:phosphate/sulfate permease